MNTGSSTHGTPSLARDLERGRGRVAPLRIERAEIDQQRVGARHERADLVRRDASSTESRRPRAARWR